MYFPRLCPVYHSRLLARKGKEHRDKNAKERKKSEESTKEKYKKDIRKKNQLKMGEENR
jgi:hypothetical protein